MECILKNPDMDVKDVYKNAYETMKDDPTYFRNVIEGYFAYINEELKKMKTFLYKSIEKKNLLETLEMKNYPTFYKAFNTLLRNKKQDILKRPFKAFTGEGFKKPKIYKKGSGTGFIKPEIYKKK